MNALSVDRFVIFARYSYAVFWCGGNCLYLVTVDASGVEVGRSQERQVEPTECSSKTSIVADVWGVPGRSPH